MVREFTINEIWMILAGAQATLVLSVMAFTGGGIFGLLVALARTAPMRWLRVPAAGFIDFFQGTPMLLQLFLVFYGLPVFGFHVNVWVAAAVGLTLHAAAFLGEIWRGGVQAVPRGQSEAASALGLSYVHRMRYVVLPQALRIAVAPTVGFAVQIVKSTALTSIIGFTELSKASTVITNATFSPFTVYACAALIYFALCWPLSRLSLLLERKLHAPHRP